DDPALGDAGGPARLEDVGRLVLVAQGDPAAHRPAAQPLVLEVAEHPEVLVALDILERVEGERAGLLQPQQGAGRVAEVPPDDVRDGRVELLPGLLDLLRVGGGECAAGGHGWFLFARFTSSRWRTGTSRC